MFFIKSLLVPGVCDGCFNKTSGARNPGVPARGAVCCGLVKHNVHTLGFPKQLHLLSAFFFVAFELNWKFKLF